MNDEQAVTLRVHCRTLPGIRFENRDKVRLGIQKGADVIEDVPGDADSVTFTVPLRVRSHPKNGQPNCLGPFAHGTPDDRFLYLCWGERNGEEWEAFRRAKVPLKFLNWERLQRPLETGEPIEISLDMTDAKGGPVCGTVRV